MKDSIKRILRDFPEKHPYLPLGLSIIGLCTGLCSIAVRAFLL